MYTARCIVALYRTVGTTIVNEERLHVCKIYLQGKGLSCSMYVCTPVSVPASELLSKYWNIVRYLWRETRTTGLKFSNMVQTVAK